MNVLLGLILVGVSFGAMAQDKISNFLGMEFVQIKAGEFLMGSPEVELGRREDERQHPVLISKNFWLQTTEVTRKQWVTLMQGDPSSHRNCGQQCPVNRVKFEWIQAFIEKLNQQDTQYSYHLPTEAQWEYAARAGTKTPFSTGKCLKASHANFKALDPYGECEVGARAKGPKPVASYQANHWGLFDMHGNVWEMVSDYYGEYPTTKVTDPEGPKVGERRVLRGSSWFSGQTMARSASRLNAKNDIAGFRLVAKAK
ncbi:hypothetical protein NBRC116188_28430 [Oceaniserpentilla sp. 4NH20-0058]|uniref:formylglycine-generating enzyme family protein n=1 Tax=Oceaniserpentilla sp. 4NH20-0058 TaxID=3127660 RepID=UPI0031087125